jgi:4-hydroxymandelate oxidase
MDLAATEREASALLPAHVADYVRATAGGPEVLTEATAAWDAFRHRPRVLRGSGAPSTGTTVLGVRVATPVLVAPMAQQIAAQPDGEAVTARAAAAEGSLLGVSTFTGAPFAAIAAGGAPWWFQVYVLEDRELTDVLLDRAVAAGASAIVLTADITGLVHPAPGAAHSVEPSEWGEVPEARRLGNLTQRERARLLGSGNRIVRGLGVDAVQRLHERTGLPIVVKGVLRGDDARRVVDAGAAAVLVSTHGGRALASAVPSARALAEVVAAVGDVAEVYVDSGIRSGRHVATALALGARAVFVGRPVWWALAARGEAGVREVLSGLTRELEVTMDLLGAGSVAELTADLVAP